MINRLLVLLQIIFIPIYFIFYTIFWNKTLIENFEQTVDAIPFLSISKDMIPVIINLGVPILFSAPWLIFSIIRANRIANAYELMGRAMGKVRIDQKLFYGVNAVFVLVFIILPYFSPLITIVAIFVASRILLRKAYIGRFHWAIWVLPAIVLSIFPALIAWAFYARYVELWNNVYAVWQSNINAMFGFGLSLAIAIAIGNFILFLMIGAKQYGTRDEVNYGLVMVLKFAIFTIMLLIYFSDPTNIVFTIANAIALVLGILQFVLARIKNVNVEENANVGLLMIPIFAAANFVSEQFPSKAIVIVLAAIIFFALFFLAYRYAEDEDLVD